MKPSILFALQSRSRSSTLVVLTAVSGIGALLLAGDRQRPAQPQNFRSLGDLPGGTCDSVAYGVSADGKAVVGYSNSAAGMEAFRWTSRGGIEGLGFTQAFAISADGASVTGYRLVDGGSEPVVWTRRGLHGLRKLPGFEHHACGDAVGVSGDGSTVVGAFWTTWGQRDEVPFLWTSRNGFVRLASSPDFRGHPWSVSADGAVVAGVIYHDFNRREAFRWTIETGIVGLGVLPGDTESVAHAVSADGSVVVGWSESIGSEGFRWTEEGGMVSLGTLRAGSRNSRALGVSADGSVVVGQCHGESGLEAFIWDQERGMRNLRELLVSQYGLAANLRGWKLRSATAVSADGSVIVGYGLNPDGNREAWIALLRNDSPIDPAPPETKHDQLAGLL